MGAKSFYVGHTSFDKGELLERMCRVGIARWDTGQPQQIALLQRELAELNTLNTFVLQAIRTRRKQLSALKRHTPNRQQLQWDETRIERTIFFLASAYSLADAAGMLGISRETLLNAVSTSIRLLKRRESTGKETDDTELDGESQGEEDLDVLLDSFGAEGVLEDIEGLEDSEWSER